jgi:hypothetical protein
MKHKDEIMQKIAENGYLNGSAAPAYLRNADKQIRDIELHRHNNQPITYGLKGDWMKTLRKVNEITSNELSKYEDGMIIDRRLHLLIERTEDQRKSLSNKASAGFA